MYNIIRHREGCGGWGEVVMVKQRVGKENNEGKETNESRGIGEEGYRNKQEI